MTSEWYWKNHIWKNWTDKFIDYYPATVFSMLAQFKKKNQKTWVVPPSPCILKERQRGEEHFLYELSVHDEWISLIKIQRSGGGSKVTKCTARFSLIRYMVLWYLLEIL